MPSIKPIYLLAGGQGSTRRSTRNLFHHIYEDYGTLNPSIAYIGTASQDDPEFFSWIKAMFKGAGTSQVRLAPLASEKKETAEAVKIIEDCDLVFVGGGDVGVGMDILKGRGIIPFLKQLFLSGKPFFGVSAGSIMLSQSWVRWQNPDDNSTAHLFPCLGLAPILCDTHAEEDGWPELRTLLALHQLQTEGFGIPSGATLRIQADGRADAWGEPVYRFRHTRRGIRELSPLQHHNLKTEADKSGILA